MSDLVNYSIETDHTVLLSFKDGRRLRVPLGQLPNHLGADDLAKITRALKLRRDFIRRHMPKAVLVLVAGGLIALGATEAPKVVAWLTHQPATPAPAPEPAAPKIVHDSRTASPTVAPSPQPAIKGQAIAQATGKSSARASLSKSSKTRGTSTQLKLPVTGTVASVTLPVTLPTPLPTVLPADPITSPSPSPSVSLTPTPSPTPQIPGQGQVLGDSTGPTK
jgi:hypothetical protein